MDFFIIFIAAALTAISTVFKLNVLFIAAFLIAVFNDFIRTVLIQKKQDERMGLIKSKADGLTYFIVWALIIVIFGISTKHTNFFQNASQLLSLILITISLVHSLTFSIFQRKY